MGDSILKKIEAENLKQFENNKKRLKENVLPAVVECQRIVSILQEQGVNAKVTQPWISEYSNTAAYYWPGIYINWLEEVPRLEVILQEVLGDKLTKTEACSDGYYTGFVFMKSRVRITIDLTKNEHCKIITSEKRELMPRYDTDYSIVCN